MNTLYLIYYILVAALIISVPISYIILSICLTGRPNSNTSYTKNYVHTLSDICNAVLIAQSLRSS